MRNALLLSYVLNFYGESMRRNYFLILFFVFPVWANNDVMLYAKEGLAMICRDSRSISGEDLDRVKEIYLNKKLARKNKGLESDISFSFFASKQLWDIESGSSPTYEDCMTLLN